MLTVINIDFEITILSIKLKKDLGTGSLERLYPSGQCARERDNTVINPSCPSEDSSMSLAIE